ncbi:myb-like dna-binding protein bas1 [Lichtheimia corymbifera JMRC:FSU:9682]|uniref:Myb-like dna-binding protein bas1 n=1 Tax=Lichtheimia corymbifera JMRC:FSU:9682 TaxID=1263082 RepID=A0A068RUS6_9FUNG|nr:myb-like dna-binding protein bas1 [Lichtheimia corymbifera JMRC:FSU:9682]
MFSTTYDFDQHGTPPTDLDDAKALAESTDARSSSSVQSSSFLSPAAGAATSLLHVQGSSGCLTGTLPTFTFIPNNHYQTQLLPTDMKHQRQSNSSCMQQVNFRNDEIIPMSNASHFQRAAQPENDILTTFGLSPVQKQHHDLLKQLISDPNDTPLSPLTTTQQQHSHHHIPTPKRQCMSSKPKPRSQRAPWTPEEDNLLRLAVQLYGDKTEKWSKIAACVPGRTNKNCRKRWFHSLDPSLRKGPWTEEEDQLLREGVMKHPNQWSKIADMLDGRTDDQCAKRWRESLDPTIDRSEWTPEEDEILVEKFGEYGSQWQKIAQHFEGRPGLHCRNRWRKLQRLMQIKDDKQREETSRLSASFVHTMIENIQSSSPVTAQPPPPPQPLRAPAKKASPPPPMSIEPVPPSPPSPLPPPPASFHMPPTSGFPILQHTHEPPSSLSDTSSLSSNISSSSILLTPHGPLSSSDTPPNDIWSKSGSFIDVNPYGCDIPSCMETFPKSSGLFNHMKSAHPNLEAYDKPYRCAVPNCTKRYKNINGLQYHLRDAKGSSAHPNIIHSPVL